jgi:SAM-dependent methyltransferase
VADYEEDLTYIHASGFTALAERAAPAIVGLLGTPRGLVVDLGCGNGVTTRALVEAGHEVLGVDTSAAMLALARHAAPEASFLQASALDVELPRCTAILAVGEVLNYTERSLDPFFRRIAVALKPSGLFVADFAAPGRVKRGGPVRTWSEGEDWAILVETVEDAPRALLERRMTTFRRVGDGWRRGAEIHRQRLHRPSALAARLRRAGFRVRIRRGYDGRRFMPGHFVVIANRATRNRV